MTFHGVIKRIHLASNLGLKSDSLKILVTPFQNLSRQTMSVGGKQIRIREDFFDTWSEIFIESEYRCLKTLGKLKKPTYFVDCGANAGWATIWFYRMFGAVSTVAFEPIPRIFSQLVENVAGLSHVTSVNAGVSVITSSVDLYDRGAGSHLANQKLWNGKDIDYGDTPPVTCKMVDFLRTSQI